MVKPPAVEALLKRPIAHYLLPGLAVAIVLAVSFLAPRPATLTGALANCSSATISAVPGSPHQPTGTVVVTGGATCFGGAGYGNTSGIPVFRFWVQPPGGAWTIMQDYSESNTFNWNINGLAPGNYGLEVDVRDRTNSSLTYETVANTIYTIQTANACGAGTLTGAPTSPAAADSTITFTATTTGCPNPRYRFWVQNPGGKWMIVQDYSTNNKYVWAPPATDHAGSYGIEVDFRDASETVSYDTHVNIVYILGCTAAGLTANPPGSTYPAPSGTTVVLTGTSTCPGTPEYKFWVLPPGGKWTLLRDYAASNTYNWLVAGLKAGMYGLEVDVRDQGSIDSYEKVANISYNLIVPPCTSAGLTAAPPNTSGTGSTVTLTASSTGCNTPVYRFWVQAPGGPWTIVRDYSTSNTFSWQSPSTGKIGNYGLEVDVRDIVESTSYDVHQNIAYTLTGCTAANMTAAPPTTQLHGVAIVFTATSTCPGTPTYRFWVKAPSGVWTIAQDYSTSNTFNYTPTTAGSYQFEVDVRDSGSTETYEKVFNITNYTVT